MNKVGAVAIVVALTVALYLLMLVVMPTVWDLAVTSNATMTASSNLTHYPGAAEGLLATPLFLWFVPGGIALAVIIIILKRT